MKKNVFALLICFFLFYLTNCKTIEHDCDINCTDVFSIYISHDDILDFGPSELFESFVLIQLDEQRNSMIGDIKKILIYDSLMFVLDDTSKILQQFTKTGKYLGQIGSIGRAPDEYLQLADFSIDNDTILLWDYRQRKMIYYTLYGDFIKEYTINDYFISFAKIKNDYWAYTAGINDEGISNKGFNLRRYKNGIQSDEYVDLFSASNFYPRTFNKTNFFRYNESAIFNYGLSNNVFKITSEGIEPYFCVNAGKYSIQYNKLKDQFQTMHECAEYLSENEFIGIISDYVESKRFIYFNVRKTKSGSLIHTIYDKEQEKVRLFTDIVNDDSGILISSTLIYYLYG